MRKRTAARPTAQTHSLALVGVRRGPIEDGDGEALSLNTDRGEIVCRYHASDGARRAVVWVGGAGGGLDGPARGLYPTLAVDLAALEEIASLRLHYRHPNDLEESVLDTLVGVEWLRAEARIERVALVGHSFGGAVVITAGAHSETVSAVVPMSSQTYGTDAIVQLDKPLLLLHGEDDRVLPPSCSTYLHQRAPGPKTIKLYPHAGHGLDECRDELIADLRDWLVENA